jgi:YfiH family protein
MIRPPGWDGVAFSEGGDGDIRNDPTARQVLIGRIGSPGRWATVRQVHGAGVVRIDEPGEAGEADALWTTSRDLAVTVFTADCFAVVVQADSAVGVAHAGWRGTDAGVVGELVGEMTAAGHAPLRAAVGPGIGPCCFEVGEEVAGRFEAHRSETTWSTTSVDLPGAISSQIPAIDTWSIGACTYHDPGWFSHRRDATKQRLAAIGWLP